MKRHYLTPSIALSATVLETLLAGSVIDSGGSNTGEDKPHTAETKNGIWDLMSDDEK